MNKFKRNIHKILPKKIYLIPGEHEDRFLIMIDYILSRNFDLKKVKFYPTSSLSDFGYQKIETEGEVYYLPCNITHGVLLKLAKIIMGSRSVSYARDYRPNFNHSTIIFHNINKMNLYLFCEIIENLGFMINHLSNPNPKAYGMNLYYPVKKK